jgi:glucosamine-6-phosphate deaminase
VEVVILESAHQGHRLAARIVAHLVKRKPQAVLGLATGRTMLGLYAELIALFRQGVLSFSQVTTFNLDEFVGLPPEHPCSYHRYMQENFFDHVDVPPRRRHLLNGLAPDLPRECQDFEERIRSAGGLDLQILGLGEDGHIGFNEPTSSLGSRTRLKTLTAETMAVNRECFGSEPVPRHVLTMGVATILEARHCLLLAFGPRKAAAVAATVEGPVTAMVPASALQLHPRVTVVLDEEAASRLALGDYYRQVYENKPDWQRWPL